MHSAHPCCHIWKVSLPYWQRQGCSACGESASNHGLSSSLLPLHRYLTATDFSECHDRQAMLKRIVLLEASVAAALGLSMVYSSPALRAKPEYYRCVSSLSALYAAKS